MMRLAALALSIAVLCVALIGCQTAPVAEPEPGFAGKVYIGDAATLAVIRKQAGEAIQCSQPAFNDLVCMQSADFAVLLQKIQFYRNMVNPKGNQ